MRGERHTAGSDEPTRAHCGCTGAPTDRLWTRKRKKTEWVRIRFEKTRCSDGEVVARLARCDRGCLR